MNTALSFFEKSYPLLRPQHVPMRWMQRMFNRLIAGNPPSLVDLPTGAGKTDLIVIWLIALAWYGCTRSTTSAVPRRLVWVVNRRVLVQQVYAMADRLTNLFNEPTGAIAEITGHLRQLCRQESRAVFNVVQLRGQRLDDREWALDPTVPQLIIGTVDQIGSRLLFQGYGQGKWSRPMQAGLLGVDAWVCVDEAHLVPAFAVTLRQIRTFVSNPVSASVPSGVKEFFDRLPFWITELSATPGLPSPRHSTPFTLQNEDEDDPALTDRLLAKRTRRVLWKPQPDRKRIARDLWEEALQIAKEEPSGAIAVFCSTVKDAEAIAKELQKEHPNRVLLVTGRIRGYERDRLEQSDLFRRFRSVGAHESPLAESLPTFLVGTSAAEVGLDADASAIVCDFAGLLTLIQRLGRLDRRGNISRQFVDKKAVQPTMTIIGGERGKTGRAQLQALVSKLASAHPADGPEFSAEYYTGAPWSVVVGKEKGENEDANAGDTASQKKSESGPKPGVKDAIAAATWDVLALDSQTKLPPASVGETHSEIIEETIKSSVQEVRQSAHWLGDPLAALTAGPVVVPPLTDTVLRRWAATTPRPSKFLPVHPWLYGLLPDDEGTPLVGIAFRLELDVLHHSRQTDEEDGGTDRTWEKVCKCLTSFPPLNSELHFVPLAKAREWLGAVSAEQQPVIAHYDGEDWTDSVVTEELSANSVLVLPTSTNPAVLDICELILKGGDESESQRCWDVFQALAEDGTKYRREVIIETGEIIPNQREVFRVPSLFSREHSSLSDGDALASTHDRPDAAYYSNSKGPGVSLRFEKDGTCFKFQYFKLRRDSSTVTELLPDHLSTASEHGAQLARALAPGNEPIASLLTRSAGDHDLGKDHPKWQRAMGNILPWRESEGYDSSVLIAKPVIENPSHAGGYRHEWGTLWRLRCGEELIHADSDETTNAFLRDLYLHCIAAHHGYFRPSMPDRGFDSPPTATKQNPLRLEAIERSGRLQRQFGYWRLAYLESLIKAADVSASRTAEALAAEDES